MWLHEAFYVVVIVMYALLSYISLEGKGLELADIT